MHKIVERNSAALAALAVGFLGAPTAFAQSQTTPGAPSSPTATPVQQDQSAATTIDDIVVTAQKREQRLSDVGSTVVAFSGDTLTKQGVTDVSQLTRIVPGLSYFTSTTATPVYSLRGVGFNESSLAAYPTISIYVDEVPLPFPAMTSQAGLDAARVEVLKGPQGTLFGANSTAGAINYIAAAPTSTPQAGGSVSFSRFDTFHGAAYVSGPLSSTLLARLSVDSTVGGAWQQSYTRPGDTLGKQDRQAARLLLDWTPTDRLTLKFNVNGWIDKSDPQATQLVAVTPANPAYPGLLALPRLPSDNARLADWSPGWGIGANDWFWQTSLRAEYDFGGVKLTSISSYASYKRDQRADQDGTAAAETNYTVNGRIKSFFQELRLSNNASSAFKWILGANYERDAVIDTDDFVFGDASGGRLFGFSTAGFFSNQKMANYAGFGNVEYSVTDKLTLKAGARYTEADRTDSACSFDTGDGGAAAFFNAAFGINPPIQPGGCFTLNSAFQPGLFSAKLDQHNVSWRTGIDYKATRDVLFYFNVAKGYKAGSFPTVEASSQAQFAPVTQESVLDFEGGVKVQAFDRRVSFEAAGFYYDYKDKQLRTKLNVFPFGPLEALANIPKSHIGGAEASISVAPAKGLTFGLAGTWLVAKVDEYTGYNSNDVITNFAGAPIPYTPKWQATANIDYEFPLGENLSGFVGANGVYHSSTYGSVGTDEITGFGNTAVGVDRDLFIKSYATLDLRAGVAGPNGRWRLSVWGRNVTNNYHWDNVVRLSDVVVRYAAMPVTYGVTFSVRYR